MVDDFRFSSNWIRPFVWRFHSEASPFVSFPLVDPRTTYITDFYRIRSDYADQVEGAIVAMISHETLHFVLVDLGEKDANKQVDHINNDIEICLGWRSMPHNYFFAKHFGLA